MPTSDPAHALKQGDVVVVPFPYADRLAEMARRHPYNWFNFFEFWPERKTEAENSS